MSPVVIQAIVLAFQEIVEIRAALLQKGEWSPEQEAAFNAKSEKILSEKQWQIKGTHSAAFDE
ncbi:MAG: hypothetical protein EBR82_64585 [Caulobacteraceae bacterium]|nr:hypothetical protein [Caulobacteraceae bacterium]